MDLERGESKRSSVESGSWSDSEDEMTVALGGGLDRLLAVRARNLSSRSCSSRFRSEI